MPVQLFENIINTLTEKSRKVEDVFDPSLSFGVISTKSTEKSQKLKSHLIKTDQEFVMIHGVYNIPSKDDEMPKEISDMAFLIMPEKGQTQEAFLKHLYHISTQYDQPAFIFKGESNPKMFIVGTTNEKWPGKGVKKDFGLFSFEKFPSSFEKFKGDAYTFERFHKHHEKKSKSEKTPAKNNNL